MSNNVLNKSAMEVLADLSKEVPLLAARMGRVEDDVRPIPEMDKKLAVMQTTIDHLAVTIGEEGLRCPFRDSISVIGTHSDQIAALQAEQGEQEGKIQSNKEDIIGVKSSLKWWGGGITTISAAIVAVWETIQSLVHP